MFSASRMIRNQRELISQVFATQKKLGDLADGGRMNDNSDVNIEEIEGNGAYGDLVDRVAYNSVYGEKNSKEFIGTSEDYIRFFEQEELSPHYISGMTKGYVRGLATRSMFEDLGDRAPETITVVDAGCGTGRLSIYLACKGLNVVAVDISEVAVERTNAFAERMGVGDRVRGVATSLADIPVADGSVDCIIGHASLHHFIKYSGIPEEFYRILRPGGACYFADSFGENRLYHLFHNKKRMAKLGDVSMDREMIKNYFHEFSIVLTPTDWFAMFDKLFMRYLPERLHGLVRLISRISFAIDRLIPARSSIALKLSGAVFTKVTKPENPR